MTRHVVRLLLVLAALIGTPAVAAAQPEVVEYYATDALGSIRVVFDATGNVTGRADYRPFGQLFAWSGNQKNVYAGIFSDPETDLDFATERMYQARTGRLTRVDPVYAGLFEPQQWNRYSYAMNNPLRYIDPTGLLGENPLCRWTSTNDSVTLTCPNASWDTIPVFVGRSWTGGFLDFPGTTRTTPSPTTTPTSTPTPTPTPTPAPNPPAPNPPVPPPPTDCPKDGGRITFASFGGVITPLLGYEVNVGLYYDEANGHFGAFLSKGVTVGFDVGLGLQFGRYSSLRTWQGKALRSTLVDSILRPPGTEVQIVESTRVGRLARRLLA
jgi:RHS repeat-associated protein